MTYRLHSDFPVPYGKMVQVLPPPSAGEELSKLISDFGLANQRLAVREEGSKESLLTQFVSNCNTHSKREARNKLSTCLLN